MQQVTYLIIGASAAGVSAANTLRRLDPSGSIICISQEAELPYNKCFLADVASGAKSADTIGILTSEQVGEKNIQLMLTTRVDALDIQAKLVITSSGHIAYTKLLIATGSSPYLPPIAGLSDLKHGVFTFHTMADITQILATIETHTYTRAVIIGAGLSGVECADSLTKRGLQVTLLDMQEHILASQLDASAATYIQERMKHAGVSFIGSTQVDVIYSENGVFRSIRLRDGRIFEADLLICATGLRPNSDLALQAGVEVRQGAIVTDISMKTNVPDVYAAGDVALVKDQVTGNFIVSTLWPDAMLQGMVAAHTMAGQIKAYPGAFQITSSAFFGLKYAAYGSYNDQQSSGKIVIQKETPESFYRIVLQDDSIRAFFLLGEATKIMPHLKRAIVTHTLSKVEQIRELIG